MVVLTVHFAPCLINAFEIIDPDVIPSQSMCVVTKIFFLVFIASETQSEKLDNDYVYEKKIAELKEEISKLKNGIKESAEELEDFIKEQNA